MIEKVNPMHPDKIADRIAGALVDMAYAIERNPKIAVEVLIGHKECHIIAETTVQLNPTEVEKAVWRICGESVAVSYKEVQQDEHLTKNQQNGLKCGDNGIFKGVPLTDEQKMISVLAREIYKNHPSDGKYILNGDYFTCCQSNASSDELKKELLTLLPHHCLFINPIGDWTGGINVDTGATNRKLGSDMADSVTGGGLHGKDLSKADVSVNIYAFMMAQTTGKPVELWCHIGQETIDGREYSEIVEIARTYIECIGGFEKFAEWGLY